MYVEGEASQSASRGSRIVGETGHGAKSSCRPVAVEFVSEGEKRKVVRAAAGRIREAEDVREQFRKSETARDCHEYPLFLSFVVFGTLIHSSLF